jgi:hypothetical protein
LILLNGFEPKNPLLQLPPIFDGCEEVITKCLVLSMSISLLFASLPHNTKTTPEVFSLMYLIKLLIK